MPYLYISSENCRLLLIIVSLIAIIVSYFFKPFGKVSDGLTNIPNVLGTNSDLSLGNSFNIASLCFILFRGIIIIPIAGLSTPPSANIDFIELSTISPLIANPTPALSEILETINALIPTISPLIFKRGPPEFPLFIAASV